MNRLHFCTMAVAASLLLSACTPGPLGTKRYQPYTKSDAAVVYTQLNEKHTGLAYLHRFTKVDDCYEDAELIYISNNFMDGSAPRFMVSRIQPNQYWTYYVMSNASGRSIISQIAFIPEAGKHYVAMSYQGVVEVPEKLELTASDDLDQIYEQYKDKKAKAWNIRDGRCKSWLSKMLP